MNSRIVICYKNELFLDTMNDFVIKILMIVIYTNWYMLCNLYTFYRKQFWTTPIFLACKNEAMFSYENMMTIKRSYMHCKERKKHRRMFLRFFLKWFTERRVRDNNDETWEKWYVKRYEGMWHQSNNFFAQRFLRLIIFLPHTVQLTCLI